MERALLRRPLVALTGLVLAGAPAARAQGASSFVARVDRTSTDAGRPDRLRGDAVACPTGGPRATGRPTSAASGCWASTPASRRRSRWAAAAASCARCTPGATSCRPSESGRLTISRPGCGCGARSCAPPRWPSPWPRETSGRRARRAGGRSRKRTRQRPRPRARLGSPFDDLFGGAADPDSLPPIQVPAPGGRAQAGSFIRAVADKTKVVRGRAGGGASGTST